MDDPDLNKLSMDQLVKLRQQAETKSFNAGENSYHQAAKHFADQASKIQDLIDVKRKKEKARKETDLVSTSGSLDIKDLNKLSMDQLVKLRQQAETKSFNAGENSYHQAAKHFTDQASKIQDLIDVKRKKEKARKEKEYMDDNVSMDEGINNTATNAMEAALAELRKLAGI
jgi:DNA polymerase III psi subunit